ncbi:rhomboid family intramembrane serine protease [Phormidium willei BDU 130791]|nr:rhomboid family intramembrane serine protease [Phormidium willei BDU 130791]
MSQESSSKKLARDLKRHILILGSFLAVMWGVHLINQFLFAGSLNSFGVSPRNPNSLRGIVLMPFLHGSFAHILSNTISFLVLGWLVLIRGTRHFLWVTLIATLVSGLGIWFFGSTGIHIGASGVIFGYLGFLLLHGLFERSLPSIALSLLVMFFYGSLIWGIFPGDPTISWEGHLFGFIGGVFAAKFLARKSRRIRNDG